MYYYSLITRDQVLTDSTFGTSYSTNTYSLLARHFFLRCIPAEKRDYIDGSRIYRIHQNHINRVDLVAGVRTITNRQGTFTFSTTFPAIGDVAEKDNSWLPVGP